MKYYYKKPDVALMIFGEIIELDHPVYKAGTLFKENEKGLIVVQQRFSAKYLYWSSIDPWLANDIYLNSHFPSYFSENATSDNYPIIQIRKLMWALRMKPLEKEYWEEYF